jgi:hypothetical protein
MRLSASVTFLVKITSAGEPAPMKAATLALASSNSRVASSAIR